MKLIRNVTRKPLKISLGGGHSVHVGPGKTAQLSDQAINLPAIKRLLEAGEIEVLTAEGHPWEGDGGAAGMHPATHGQHHEKMSLPKGNR